MGTTFIKAEGAYAKGTKLTNVYLDRDSVRKAMANGVKEGDRVTVKAKVGKHRKIFRATLMGLRDYCCDEHKHNTPYAYMAER
jgi:hypothetical protein